MHTAPLKSSCGAETTGGSALQEQADLAETDIKSEQTLRNCWIPEVAMRDQPKLERFRRNNPWVRKGYGWKET